MQDIVPRLNAALEDRYRIEQKLGEGGMAKVYLADDLRHERKVALKVLKAEVSETFRFQRFLTEIRTTANLQHPHILPLFDSGEADGKIFYVMPFVEGESLRDRLDREAQLPVGDAVRLIMQVATALGYAHQHGVIHRDIKPENIMLSGGLPVVADFGISLALHNASDPRMTEEDAYTGSLLYGSPEQLTGEAIDARSDLYSVACVLYELIVGEAPHASRGNAAILAKKLTGSLTPMKAIRSTVPDYLDEVVSRALAPAPADRFETMADFVEALQEGLSLDGAPRLKALGNLPAQSTNLIGRDEALDDVLGLLETARLVTLSGMGGLGKTRLAIETASRAATDFPDGTWFVDLAALTDARAVWHAAAGVFGVTQQNGKTIEESLVDAFGGRRLLLVLDNCEHVLSSSAALAHAVLSSCPEVKIIATSREALSITGENLWPVPALEVDGVTAPAVELFAERARAVVPDFEMDDQGETVADICRHLDGIPLAIELAAARVRSLSPSQILERLGQRFRLLTGGSRAPDTERHQTLRRAVQWSYDLLKDSERSVLARSTVFAGGFTLEAAEYVCADEDVDAMDVVDLLDSLVSKSLLTVERSGGAVRYGMLETIRSFGGEMLAEAGEEDEVRRRHGQFYALQSGQNFEIWRSPRELKAYEWLDLEIANLRVAFRWAVEHDEVDIAARIASDVGDMGRFRLHEEAAFWAEEIVERAREVRHPRLAVLLTWSASSAWAFSRFDDAQRFGEDAIALRDDEDFDPFIWAYGDLAFVAMFAGDIDKAIELFRTGSEHPTDRTDRFMLGFLLYILATAGHVDEALAVMDDITAKVDEAGVPMSVSVAYGGKGAALEGSDPAAALDAYEHSVAVARDSGNRFMEALMAPRIAALHARSGEPAVALQSFERMLAAFGEMTDIASVSAWRASLAVLLGKLGHLDAAATLHGTFADAIDVKGVVPEHADAIAAVQQELGEEAFSRAVARGAAMSLREATDYAIEQVQIGLSSLGPEDEREEEDE